MAEDLFHGKLVRLAAEEPEQMAIAFSKWGRDVDYSRQLQVEALAHWSVKKFKDWLEKDLETKEQQEFFFPLHTLEGDRLIGFVGIWGIAWNHGDAYISIGIGEGEYRGKGYGTDAMFLALGYAFNELKLHRISLVVYENNLRAIRSYEKVGFKDEGHSRQAALRDGKRQDIVCMGILREEWQQRELGE